MKRSRGMTLLELMAALAVFAVGTALAVAGMRGDLERRRESGAARELESSAVQARQRAQATQQPIRFVVDANVRLANGTVASVARWERPVCDNTWDSDSCPATRCLATTCRQVPSCCDEVGEDIPLPPSMDASSVSGLCFLPASGRPVRVEGDLGCLRASRGLPDALAAAAPGTLTLTYSSGRVPTLFQVEGLTGGVRVLDCDAPSASAYAGRGCP
ncbi:Tfp pilus assembly protein FimT/FimU [Corallococcus sp. AS-1-12]|uniref:pilus assembly FimT family protein n=1 Tax=Corallococcus sp. AS-1-12 TaxID=2874598 RepID=UPI001CBF003C|nr:prepilin-type N-terminal cleavage/methylation domain-containing protein [Corallococcus sp. AS-1-12]MBZ4329315.1 prepilin-type N-terminal cleavage/methylation domain-containing protein [Corallococcus sp. AS-1-12]